MLPHQPFTATDDSRIPARSKRRAMDWSLALISQGIESTIDYSEESGWSLIVPPEERGRALQILQQYRRENRHWPWRRPLVKPEVLFDWGSLVWVFLIGLFFWLSERAPAFRSAGVMDSHAVAHGQWWRLFTAIYLHADIGHLTANAAIGVALLGIVMGRFGTGVGLLAAYLAGAGGNLLDLIVYKNGQSLGASGMVMGCVGLLAAQSISWTRHPQARKYAVTGLLGGALLFVLLGLSPDSDVVAHFGGFLTGVLLGAGLVLAGRFMRNTAADVASGALFSALTLLPWWLALR